MSHSGSIGYLDDLLIIYIQSTVKYFIFVGFNFRGFLKINKFVGL